MSVVHRKVVGDTGQVGVAQEAERRSAKLGKSDSSIARHPKPVGMGHEATKPA
jgi:hypothetical protein